MCAVYAFAVNSSVSLRHMLVFHLYCMACVQAKAMCVQRAGENVPENAGMYAVVVFENS